MHGVPRFLADQAAGMGRQRRTFAGLPVRPTAPRSTQNGFDMGCTFHLRT
jgi:hypothetical protein